MAAEQIAGSNLFKSLYPDDVPAPGYKSSKAFGRMGKDTKFVSDGTKYVVVSIAPGAGGSASIVTALANQSATQQVRFSLGRKKLYEVGSIDGEAVACAKNGGGDNSKGAIVDVVKNAMKRAGDAFDITLSRSVWNNGGGARGRITAGSNVATNTITLTNRTDLKGFFKGMVLQSAPNDGYSAVTSPNAGTATVVSIDRSAGTITFAAALNTLIAGVAASDYLFRAGDYGAYPSGIPAWAPPTTPGGGDNFLGVNRSTAGDVNYLSGWRIAGGGQPKQSTLIDMLAEANFSNVSVDTVFMNPFDIRDTFKEQSTYKTIDVKTDKPNVGYTGIKLLGLGSDVTVMEETDCPVGFSTALNMSDWTCRSVGECPQVLDFDGLKAFLRNPNGDDYQFRLGCYLNYESANPANAVIASFA